MLCSPESLSDTVIQWWVSCAKNIMKAMGETCEELGGMFKTIPHCAKVLERTGHSMLVRWIRGYGGRNTAPFFLGVPVPRLTFWEDPEEAERLGLGDCFPKGRIPGEQKLIYGFI